MKSVRSGITASIVATVITGAVMLMNNAVHRLPNLGMGKILATAMGVPDHPAAGWLAFLIFGMFLWGIVFAYVAPAIPIRSYLVKGLLLALACWLFIGAVIMPLAGIGMFGAHRPLAPALTLVLALVYWSALSLVYRWCLGSMASAAATRSARKTETTSKAA